MHNDESVLVIFAFIFAVTLYFVMMIRGPKLSIFNQNAYFNKSKMPEYFRFLAFVGFFSFPLGYMITRQTYLVFEFVGLNLLIGAIMGIGLILYERRRQNKQ